MGWQVGQLRVEFLVVAWIWSGLAGYQIECGRRMVEL